MRSVSDRLCREYGLSVIEHPHPGMSKQYGEWRAEQEGRPTYRSIVREDVDEAITQARTEKQFFHYLKEKGYSIKFGKDITLRPEGRDRGLKLERNFGEEYSLESIRRRILEEKPPAIQKEERQTKKKRYVVHVKGNLPKRKIGGLRGLYLHYCFLLGILPKNRPPVSPKQLHFLLREYFPEHDAFCRREGKLMEAFLQGKPRAAENLSEAGGQTEKWRKLFFGELYRK